ncbi:MAG: hypothetical protein HQL29_05160 [Candidatus Omnitrophica bacterium]|nr:hypothetical protein [Candidatus Omnitrophota bacterium]
MIKIIFETEDQADKFLRDCVAPCDIPNVKEQMKLCGYIKQSPVKEAKELIEYRKTTAWESDYHQRHKEVIIEFEKQLNILIKAIEYLEARQR